MIAKNVSYIIKENFYNAPSAESITRARRKVQEIHPNLSATQKVKVQRMSKENTKGNFIFNEE